MSVGTSFLGPVIGLKSDWTRTFAVGSRGIKGKRLSEVTVTAPSLLSLPSPLDTVVQEPLHLPVTSALCDSASLLLSGMPS